jgi:transcription antitermination factor NusG
VLLELTRKSNLPSKDGEALSDHEQSMVIRGLGGEGLVDHFSSAAEWFAVYTLPRHEKHTAANLISRQIEAFVPLYRTTCKWKKRSPEVLELPLFPTYLFVRIEWGARTAVLSTPGVMSIIGSGRNPWPVPEGEVEALRSGLYKYNVEPHPYLVVGERVRITRGPLTGMEGVLLRKKSGFRVVLGIDQIMSSFAVEVATEDVEPAV